MRVARCAIYLLFYRCANRFASNTKLLIGQLACHRVDSVFTCELNIMFILKIIKIILNEFGFWLHF